MKKIFKLSFVALTLTISLIACKGNKATDKKDSTGTDSMSTQDTTRRSRTTIKTDTVKPATDTSDAKVDTVSKKISSKTEVKKKIVKKSKPQ